MSPGADLYYPAITGDTRLLADLVAAADWALPVPTCPDWTLRQLTTHVGRAHRWAAEIVSTKAAEPIPFRQVPDGRLPDDASQRPDWLRVGAARLVGVLAAANDEPVWTHLGSGPASYWARRMTHETAVHRADAEIAVGRRPEISPQVAADGIDEFLCLVTDTGDADGFGRLLTQWQGHSLHIHSTDQGPADGGPAWEWTILREPPGVRVERGHAKAQAAIRGPASALLLVLMRRLPADDPAVEVLGDRAVLDTWLDATAF